MKTKIIKVNGKEMIERPVACAMLAFDEKDNVIMVEQDRGSFGTILEVPAGKIDAGETPMHCAIRELKEETGYSPLNCHHLISYYPSVGYSTEEIQCFYTEKITLKPEPQRLDDGERINVKKFYWKDLMEMIYNGDIKDSKTIMCMYAFGRNVGF